MSLLVYIFEVVFCTQSLAGIVLNLLSGSPTRALPVAAGTSIFETRYVV